MPLLLFSLSAELLRISAQKSKFNLKTNRNRMNSQFQLYYIGVLSRDPRDLGTLVLSFQESGIVGVLGTV